jgi:hypothetical protein
LLERRDVIVNSVSTRDSERMALDACSSTTDALLSEVHTLIADAAPVAKTMTTNTTTVAISLPVEDTEARERAIALQSQLDDATTRTQQLKQVR